MIHHLWMKNFGPYESADVELGGFNVILGTNGSGKSLLFGALKAIGRIARFPLRSARPHLDGYPTRTGHVTFDEIVHRCDTSRTMRLGVKFTTKEVSGEYEVAVGHWHNPGGVVVSERLHAKNALGELKISAHPDGSLDAEPALSMPTGRFRTPRVVSIPGLLFRSRDPREAAIAEQVQKALSERTTIYRFDPTALKAPAEVGKALSPTGYNFATYLDQNPKSSGRQAGV
ncbi:MAG: AAA family ATPase [Anaeromyxobacteraceae bacterium]